MNKKLLSRQETAQLFGVRAQTISNWVNSGLLTLVIKKNRHFITYESVQHLLSKFSDVKDITLQIEQYRNTMHELHEEIRLRRRELYMTRLFQSTHPRRVRQVLNAKDYGVPQNRERIFMISILDAETFLNPRPLV